MYMKAKELGWGKKNRIPNTSAEDSQGNITIHQKIWENSITDLNNQPNQPENLGVKPLEVVHAYKKGHYILQSEVEKPFMEIMMYLWATFVPFSTYQDLLPVSHLTASRDMPILAIMAC